MFGSPNPSVCLCIALPKGLLGIRLDLTFEVPRGLHDLVTIYLNELGTLLPVHRQSLKTLIHTICLGLHFDKLPLT